jgi:hypothetical protein
MKIRALTIIVGMAIWMSAPRASAQEININDIIQAGGEDMSVYMGHYVKPFMDAFGTGMTAAWYNTAKNHEKLGFDLTLSMSLVVVPDENKLFTFNESDYQNLYLFPRGTTTTQLPTMMGPDPATAQQLQADGTVEGVQVLSQPFNSPGGIEDDLKEVVSFAKSSAPVPMVQFGLGTVKNTDIIVRWTPYLSIGGADQTELKIFGLAIKHDIKQWIPGLKRVPIDLSVLVGYTMMDMKYSFESTSFVDITNGEGLFKLNTWTFQALVSKEISVVTFYGGVGYNTVSSNLKMNGLYEFDDITGTVRVGVQDPVNEDFSINSARFTAGMRLKFAVFTLHGDYTFQEYNTFTFGLGFSVR